MIKFLSLVAFLSTFVQGEAQVQVMHPEDLRIEMGVDGIMPSVLSNFGHIQYGTTMFGKVSFPKTNQHGCEEFKSDDFDAKEFDHYNQYENSVEIILVESLSCSITTKVRNAEKFGAKLVLIVATANKEVNQGAMQDDGTGFALRTPAFLIGHTQGQAMIKSLEDNQIVTVRASMEIAYQENNNVEYSLWYANFVDLDTAVLYNLGQYQEVMRKNTTFVPHVLTISCPGCPQEIKEENCVSNGTYCFLPPINGLPVELEEVPQRDLLLELLRSKCIYNQLMERGDMHEDLHKFFNYMVDMQIDCVKPGKEKRCAYIHLWKMGLKTDDVQRCIDESWAIPGDEQSENAIFAEEKALSIQQGISMHPLVQINNYTYRGDFDSEDIFQAICSSFNAGQTPEFCKETFDLKLALGPSYEEYEVLKRIHRYIKITIFVLVILSCNLCCLYAYRRYHRKEVSQLLKEEVTKEVTHYFKLNAPPQGEEI